MTKIKGPSTFVSEAYQLDDEVDSVEFYKKWADDYDHQMLVKLEYVAPIGIARLLCEFLPNKESEIFDVGCGTGLTCRFLADNGYQALDGIDLSPDMVRVASEQGIYRDLIVGDVNVTIQRDSSSYDGVISSGTFTHGHVGPEPLDDIFRILRPGGVLACTVHKDLWTSRGFKQKLDSLVNEGQARCLHLQKDKYYETDNIDGWFCVYQKVS
ncbi:MAG: class I SAM-dependent methyltransferase [Porticoccaceae bacterium]|jgi:predicted TPR repeat methyltransferase|tara:strand:+ start:1281 stop:1916 length:636 start_codon:yes stop_codon:yes gene_type:complete